jgi:hypothetical protein
MVSQKEE